jgi:Transposase.
MGRPKGGTNKHWTQEEKLEVVLEVLKHENSLKQISKAREISMGMIHTWTKRYLEDGKSGLENKKKIGNPYRGLHLKKELTDLEKLQLENMKLKVENERLKKGYIVEGDGQTVTFDKSKFPNLK